MHGTHKYLAILVAAFVLCAGLLVPTPASAGEYDVFIQELRRLEKKYSGPEVRSSKDQRSCTNRGAIANAVRKVKHTLQQLRTQPDNTTLQDQFTKDFANLGKALKKCPDSTN